MIRQYSTDSNWKCYISCFWQHSHTIIWPLLYFPESRASPMVNPTKVSLSLSSISFEKMTKNKDSRSHFERESIYLTYFFSHCRPLG